MTTEQKCCLMVDGERCGKDAEFAIYGESSHPDDETMGCEDHVGALLGSPTWLKKDNLSWTVSVLTVREGTEQ